MVGDAAAGGLGGGLDVGLSTGLADAIDIVLLGVPIEGVLATVEEAARFIVQAVTVEQTTKIRGELFVHAGRASEADFVGKVLDGLFSYQWDRTIPS